MCACTQNAVVIARADVPEHITPLAALAASERASVRPRQRLLRLLQCGAQIEAKIARTASAWWMVSSYFDGMFMITTVLVPMARRALTGSGATATHPLWALYVRWLGRLSFGGRCVCRPSLWLNL